MHKLAIKSAASPAVPLPRTPVALRPASAVDGGAAADATPPNVDEWIDEQCARFEAEQRAKLRLTNPRLAEAYDRIDTTFPRRGRPGTPQMRLVLRLDYARLYQGARVIIADGFTEVEQIVREDGSSRVLA